MSLPGRLYVALSLVPGSNWYKGPLHLFCGTCQFCWSETSLHNWGIFGKWFSSVLTTWHVQYRQTFVALLQNLWHCLTYELQFLSFLWNAFWLSQLYQQLLQTFLSHSGVKQGFVFGLTLVSIFFLHDIETGYREDGGWRQPLHHHAYNWQLVSPETTLGPYFLYEAAGQRTSDCKWCAAVAVHPACALAGNVPPYHKEITGFFDFKDSNKKMIILQQCVLKKEKYVSCLLYSSVRQSWEQSRTSPP